MKPEVRFLSREIRVEGDSTAPKIKGYASVFNSLSEDLGGFREQIASDAFDACLASNCDCRALFNHDPNMVLGRTTAGTLKLTADSTGLAYEIDPPDTQVARDLMTSMKRGDIDQSSFGFYCLDDTWDLDTETNALIRTVRKATVFDVSPVTYPAYTATSSGIRNQRDLFPEGVIELPPEALALRNTEPPAEPSATGESDDDLALVLMALQQ